MWAYKTRKGEEASRLTILAIDDLLSLGAVVHVQVDGLQIESDRFVDMDSTKIGHMPFSESALKRSVVHLERSNAPLPDFAADHEEWKTLVESGQAGLFTDSVADGVAFMEKTLQREDRRRKKAEEKRRKKAGKRQRKKEEKSKKK